MVRIAIRFRFVACAARNLEARKDTSSDEYVPGMMMMSSCGASSNEFFSPRQRFWMAYPRRESPELPESSPLSLEESGCVSSIGMIVVAHRHRKSKTGGDWEGTISAFVDISNINLVNRSRQCGSRRVQLLDYVSADHAQKVDRRKIEELVLTASKYNNTNPQ